MRNRRFLLLAATLVTLNAALWLVPQGFALSRVAVSTLFGRNMVRAQVLENSGQTWHVDRGIVVSNAAGVLTLHEADGAVQAITTSSSTKTSTPSGVILKVKNVKPGWRVLVTWPAPNGPADSVLVEKRGLGG